MQENVLVVEKHGFICTVSLNRPEKRNALSEELLQQLIRVMKTANDDPSVRVIILRGAGDKAFCAGYDIGQIPSDSREPQEEAIKDRGLTSGRNLLQAATESIVGHRCPVIAMIHGVAMGAGCDLAAACDLRLAADTARLGIPPVKLGVFYYPEGLQRIIDLVGPAAAKELFFTGDAIDAKRAGQIGLVNKVVAAKELESTTYDLAANIARNAPLSVSGLKVLISRLQKKPPLSQEDEELSKTLMARCLTSYDLQEGIRAFREKRPPKFEGR